MFILLTLMWNMIASAGKREWIVNQNIRKSNIFGHNICICLRKAFLNIGSTEHSCIWNDQLEENVGKCKRDCWMAKLITATRDCNTFSV